MTAPTPPNLDTEPPPCSWIQAHAEYFNRKLRAQGHDEASAQTTLATALIEEAADFTTAYTHWLTDSQRVCGEADVLLALAGVVGSAYGLAHLLGAKLDQWMVLKLRHLYTETGP